MVLWKPSGCVLMAVWLLAMTSASVTNGEITTELVTTSAETTQSTTTVLVTTVTNGEISTELMTTSAERQTSAETTQSTTTVLVTTGAQENTLHGPNMSLNFAGTNATFTCVSPLSDCVDMTWHQEFQDPISNTSWRRIDNDIHPNFTNKFIVENSTLGCKLTVTNVQVDDNGDFMCEFNNSLRGTAALVVIGEEQEKRLRGPANKFGIVDWSIFFTCVSPLKSCVGMNWFIRKEGRVREAIYNASTGSYNNNNTIITSYEGGCHLVLEHLELNDAGSIICEVVISERTFRKSATLLVFKSGENPLNGPEHSLSYVGTDATFTCVSPLEDCANMIWSRSYLNESTMTYSWIPIDYRRSKGKYRVFEFDIGCSLIIRNVQVNDSGFFECQFMEYFYSEAELIVKKRQRQTLVGLSDAIALVGSNVTFTCVSPLRNCHLMTWYEDVPSYHRLTIFNGSSGSYHSDKYTVEGLTIQLMPVGCRLTVKHVELLEAYYSCSIKVSDEVYSEEARLYAFSEQQGNPLQRLNDSLNFVGEDAEFICVSPVGSCANIIWYKDNGSSHWISLHSIRTYDHIGRAKYKVKHYYRPNSDSTLGCILTVTNVQFIDYGAFMCEFLHTFKRTAELRVYDPQQELTGPVNSFGYVGSNVVFDCVSPLGECPIMNWYQQIRWPQKDIVFTGQSGNYSRAAYIVENSTVGCQLTVRSVRPSDAGTYICELLISNRAVEASAKLLVFGGTENPLKGPPSFLGSLGEDTIFNCDSPLKTCDNMTWQRGNGSSGTPISYSDLRGKYELRDSTSGCQLIIRDTQANDSGPYTCRFMKTFERTAELHVIGSEENPLTGSVNTFGYVGSNVSFTCISPLGNCTGMNWYQDTERAGRYTIYGVNDPNYFTGKYTVENSTEGCKLTVKRLQLSDAATFVCNIHFSRASIERAAILLVLRDGENPLKGPLRYLSSVGEDGIFNCYSPLKTCDNMTWHRGNGSFGTPISYSDLRGKYGLRNSTSGCQLIITDTQVNDSGPYTCRFMNTFQGTAELHVIDTTTNPLTAIDSTERYVGSNVTFNCGSPLRSCIAIWWYKIIKGTERQTIFNGSVDIPNKYSVENSNTGCQLAVKNLELSDIGAFVCSMVISSIPYERTAFLQVHRPLKGHAERFSAVGKDASFQCLSPLGTCANITWHRGNESFMSPIDVNVYQDFRQSVTDKYVLTEAWIGCVLILRDAQLDDAGPYLCRAMDYSFLFATELYVVDTATYPLTEIDHKEEFVGSNVTFSCASPLKNCLAIRWHKIITGRERQTIFDGSAEIPDKYSVQNPITGCQLTVKNLELSDIGEFVCTMVISSITYERSAFLHVHRPLKGYTERFCAVGKDVSFQCLSPLETCANITWHRGNESLISQIDFRQNVTDKYVLTEAWIGCVLIVRDAQLDDAGSYTCRFMNYSTQLTTDLYVVDTTTLRAIDNAEGYVGANATLTCGSPLRSCLSILWFKIMPGTVGQNSSYVRVANSDKYSVENSTTGCQLTVKNLELSDIGEFVCTMVVSSIPYERSAFLQVHRPNVSSIRMLTTHSVCAIGKNATFQCLSPLETCANITWHRGRESLEPPIAGHAFQDFRDKYIMSESLLGCQLILRNAELNDTGLYACRFMNSYQVTTELYVLDTVTYPLTAIEDTEGFVGSNVSFSCGSPLRDCFAIRWYKTVRGTERQTIFDGSVESPDKYSVENSTTGCQLTVKTLELSDIGEFVCTMLVSSITYERTAFLHVHRPLKGHTERFCAVGKDASFQCLSPLGTCANITWYRGKEPLEPLFQFRVYPDFSRPVRDKYVLTEDRTGCLLVLRDAQLDDTGPYACRFMNYSTQLTTELYVVDTITLTAVDNAEGYVGSNVSLTCGSPLRSCLSIRWFRIMPGTVGQNSSYVRVKNSDKYSVENSTTGCQLTVKHLELSDIGEFVCTMEISSIPYERTAFLLVHRPNVSSIRMLTAHSICAIGKNATFQCLSPLENCVNITWHRGRESLEPPIAGHAYPDFRDKYIMSESLLGCQLILRNAQLSDTGPYTCRFMNSFQVTSELYALDTTTNPLTEIFHTKGYVGSIAGFTCGSPLRSCLSIRWFKIITGTEQQNISYVRVETNAKYSVKNSTSGCQLTIKNLELSDAGVFACRMVISLRSYQRTANLLVLEIPKSPLRMFTSESVCAAGRNISFQCLSPSESCDNVTWHKGKDSLSSPLVGHADSDFRDKYALGGARIGCLLILRNAELNDTGPYTCRYMNSSQVTTEIFVVDTTTNPLTEMNNTDGYVGSNATFNCGSPLRNCLAIRWYKILGGTKRELIFHGSIEIPEKFSVHNSTTGCQLTVKNLELSDAGTFVCRISASSRHYETTAFLLVHKD